VRVSRDEIGGRDEREPLVPRRVQAGLVVLTLALAAVVVLPRLGEPAEPDAAAPSRSPTPTPSRAAALPGDFAPSTDVGFIGLPPAGTTPSSPAEGELVLEVWTRPARVWVYADGRLISLRYTDLPKGADPVSTGLLEQQLTLSGVERLRSYVAGSGAGLSPAPDRPATGPRPPLVRVGGRLRAVDRPSASCDSLSCRRVTNPGSWLPPDAWRRERLTAYVPSRFAVCYGLRDDSTNLAAAPAVPDESLFGRTGPGDRRLPADWPCSVVPTQRAARIVETLRGARVLRDSAVASEILAYVIDVRSPRPGSPPHEARLFFEPLLPDARWPCSACG
jgi:hypothetical protein